MAKAIIDLSGRGGLSSKFYGNSDQTSATPNRIYQAKDGEMVSGFFNPFMRDGFLSPAIHTDALHSFTFTSGTHNALIGSSVYDPINNDFYLAERGQQIFKGDGLDDTALTQELDLGSTGTPVIMDLEIYQINGTRKLFFVYEKSGNMDVGISNLPYDTGTDDLTWLTATVAGSFTNAITTTYAFLRVSDNGFMYLFQDNAVHKIDGTTNGGSNGTVSSNTLLFPNYFQLTDAVDYRGNLFIVVHQSTTDIRVLNANGSNFSLPCGVYIWDRQSQVARMSDYIPLEGVRCINKLYVSPKGDLRMICTLANKLVQIRSFNGSNFVPIRELGLGAAPSYADSLAVSENLTYWIAPNGSVYAHGSNTIGDSEKLAALALLKSPEGDPSSNITSGAILYGAADGFSGDSGYRTSRQGIALGYNDGAQKIRKFFPHDKGTINSVAQASQAGDVYTPVVFLPYMSRIEAINVVMATGTATGSSTQGTLKIYFNGSSTAWASKAITRNDIARGYVHFQIRKPYVNSIQLEVEFATGTTWSDTYDFHPAYAEVIYTPNQAQSD